MPANEEKTIKMKKTEQKFVFLWGLRIYPIAKFKNWRGIQI